MAKMAKVKSKAAPKNAVKVLSFEETDSHWFTSIEKSNYGFNNNDNELMEDLRSRTWSVYKDEPRTELFKAKTRKEAAEWLSKKTGKKIVFKKRVQ